MDIKKIHKYISDQNINCEIQNFFFDSENTLHLHISSNSFPSIFKFDRAGIKSLENKIKKEFSLRKFNIIFIEKQNIILSLVEIFKKYRTLKKNVKIFHISDNNIKIYLNKDILYLKQIKKDIEKALNKSSINFEIIEILNIENIYETPSILAILRVIKKRAPADINIIKKELINKNFSIQVSFLKKKLDKIRKEGMILYTNGKYALTQKSLSILPVTKDRNSSDIERVLDLGRKKW